MNHFYKLTLKKTIKPNEKKWTKNMNWWFTEKEIKTVLNHTKWLIVIYNKRNFFYYNDATVFAPGKDQKFDNIL